jgi:tetratricopeptide (TPR) repeat protein
VFSSLSVFAGGCTVEAAESVCGAHHAELASLTRRSLVVDRGGRVEMLETIREYARELLDASAEAQTLQRGHASYYAALAEQGERRLRGPEAAPMLELLERDHDNFRAALAWAHESAEAGLELGLAAALARFWWMGGHLREGRALLERALSGQTEQATALRVTAYRGAASLAMGQGAHPEARVFAERAVALCREAGDALGLARSLNVLGNIAVAQADFALARASFDESVPLARAGGDEHALASVLSNAGNLALNEGDFERATALARESLALSERLGQREGVSIGLLNIGLARALQGRWEEASATTRSWPTGWRPLRPCWPRPRGPTRPPSSSAPRTSSSSAPRRRSSRWSAGSASERSRACESACPPRTWKRSVREDGASIPTPPWPPRSRPCPPLRRDTPTSPSARRPRLGTLRATGRPGPAGAAPAGILAAEGITRGDR